MLAIPGSSTVPPLANCWRCGLIDAVTLGNDVLLVHTLDHAELRLTSGRLVPGPGYEHAPRAARRELVRVGAMLRVRQRGLFHVHAAGVVDPAGRAWLLAGDSGSGKSTLAYALARLGWPVLGDDGVLVARDDDGLVVYAWRDPLQVSIELADEFPELMDHAATVDWSDPRHRASVGSITIRRAPIGGIMFVQRSAQDVVVPMPQTAALAGLIRQSSTVLIADSHAANHLAVLGALAATAPAFRLEHTSRQLHAIDQTITEAAA